MYVPAFNAIDDEDAIRAMVAAARAGWLVTVSPEGLPVATFLTPDVARGQVVAHRPRRIRTGRASPKARQDW